MTFDIGPPPGCVVSTPGVKIRGSGRSLPRELCSGEVKDYYTRRFLASPLT